MAWSSFVAPIVGVLGVGIGLVAARGRELRDMQRRAYVEWIKVARQGGTWPGMPPAAGPVALPHPETIAKLNELSSELGVVGSWNVLAKAQDFRDEVRKPEFAAKINKAKSLNQTIDLHDEETTPFRDAVVIAMRRDLFPWWRWRQRRRPEPPP